MQEFWADCLKPLTYAMFKKIKNRVLTGKVNNNHTYGFCIFICEFLLRKMGSFFKKHGVSS